MNWRSLILLGALALAMIAVPVARMLLPRPPDRLPTAAGYRFLAGVNYPWKSYQDFGSGAWGHSGVSSPGVFDEIDTDMANVAATGIQVVKWRVFNDGRFSPDFMEDGSVSGLDEQFFHDLDAALEIAARHDLYLVLSLIDSGFWATQCSLNGVQMGGHIDLMSDPAKHRSLIQKAIVPLVERAKWSGRVIAYEVIAEPEWGITELHTEDDGRQTVPLADVRDFVAEATTAIHRHGGRLVTVESNRPTHMQYWKDLGLDYFTFSWYDWMEPYDPLDVPAASYGLDRPVVLGEYPIEGSQHYSFSQVMDIALRQGYAGAFAWSYGASDKYGSLRNVHDRYAQWLADHWQVADLSGGRIAPPSAPIAFQPPPFAYQSVRLAKDTAGLTADVGLSVREGGTFHLQAYLYPRNGQPDSPVADRTLALQSGAQGTVHMTLPDVPQGEIYKLSMAIFDENWTIRKWFDSIYTFVVENGEVARPSLTDLETENPCAKPKQ
ncbi:MAG: hypothetical protein ACM3US_07035 [Sphingomonadaceae bacterium]